MDAIAVLIFPGILIGFALAMQRLEFGLRPSDTEHEQSAGEDGDDPGIIAALRSGLDGTHGLDDRYAIGRPPVPRMGSLRAG